MFDASVTTPVQQLTAALGVPVDASRITAWTQALATAAPGASGDSARVDLLTALERLKRVVEATQADLAVDVDASMRATAEAEGVGKRRVGRGIPEQLALARMESPHRATQHLAMAKVLRSEMPHTLAAFRAGAISEYAVMRVVQETASVDLDVRKQIDAELCADQATVLTQSPRQVRDAARRRAGELDPASVAAARAKAEQDRRVTIRPAPETMTYVTGHLPVAQGVAVYAALRKAADQRVAAGDERSRGQIMADTLVERVTGQATACGVPVAINLVVPASTLLDGGSQAGHLDGAGAVPADLARDLVTRALDAPTGDQVGAWLRTVYAGPHGGLVAMDSRSRTVPAGLGVLVRIRDGSICRTPWCDAPIRHTDHAQGAAEGGPTAEPNLQGTCEGCNYAKQAPGWTAAGDHPPGGRHRVVTTTPTGHTHTSTAPPLPGQGPDGHQPELPEQPERRVRVLVLELYRGTRIDYTPIA